MSTGISTAHSVVEPGRRSKQIAAGIVIVYALDLDAAARLDRSDQPEDAAGFDQLSAQDRLPADASRATATSSPRARGRRAEYLAQLPPPSGTCEQIARDRNMVVVGASNYVPRFINSLIIAFGSTFCAVALGTLSAYGFSRFKVPLKDDLLFFILSTRMMPPIAVAIPIYLMYRELGLSDTKLGMILLYTAVNVSLAVWLLKGFIDEIPREYEDAAMIDGYTRLQAFRKVVLPQAATGIAATAIFCLIFAWNEYAFAVLLTSGEAQTAPPFIPIIIGEGGQDWPAVAAGTTLFLIPILVFTVLLRKHLLRGITFGAVRK